jgi:hypothetical protein
MMAGRMAEKQLDLFAHRGAAMERGLSRSTHDALLPAEIDDESLIAAIPESTIGEGCKLVAEAARRRLAAAVPALAALCRSFTGFGTRRMIPEQTAAIEALAIIGGREAAHAVSEMIERAVVQGPGLQLAVSAAARLGSVLSLETLCQLLRHAEPRIRADACRCARPLPALILLLIDLLDDLDQGVATSAACALIPTIQMTPPNFHGCRPLMPLWAPTASDIKGPTDLDWVCFCFKAEISRCALDSCMAQERSNCLQIASAFQNVESLRPA